MNKCKITSQKVKDGNTAGWRSLLRRRMPQWTVVPFKKKKRRKVGKEEEGKEEQVGEPLN